MLVNPSTIEIQQKPDADSRPEPQSLVDSDHESMFVADDTKTLIKAIGQLKNGFSTHYYSWGNFNLVRLMLYMVRQTGPVHCLMTSYSFSQTSIEQLQNFINKGLILTFRVLIDNRVKTMSPLPFQMLMDSFDYRCTSVHAKVALLWNDQWKISVVTSQNATDNPKLERGTIFTDPAVFHFDLNILENEFKHGTP